MSFISAIKPEPRLELLLRRFACAAKSHHSALEEMNAERSAAQTRILTGLYRSITSCESGADRLTALIDCDDPIIAGMAAVYSIQRETTRCLQTLKKISLEPGLIGFRAAEAVNRWESGEWPDIFMKDERMGGGNR